MPTAASPLSARRLAPTLGNLKGAVTEVNIQYQKWDASSHRPVDYAMNEKEIVVDSIAAIPAISDHILFMLKSDGEEGVYKVRTRLLNHSVHPDTDEWRIFGNIVLEEIDSSSELIKE